MSERMTKAERDDLARLVRRREKLAKADADRVAAERLAEFEKQMASIYQPADHPVWAELYTASEEMVREADRRIAEVCRELGIPEKFRPGLNLYWYGRGENAVVQRRVELRKVAQTRIAADVKTAKLEIERRSVEVQTELVAGGLESDEARRFLDSMPTAEALMPPAPPLAEIEAAIAKTGRRRDELAAIDEGLDED